MTFNRVALALLSSCVAGGILVSTAHDASARDSAVTLSGCLVRGEGDGAGYLLINSRMEPSGESTSMADAIPGAVGTTGDFVNVFYWLDGDRDLQQHVGNRVEVDGYTKDDVKPGEMKIDRKDNWTEMTVKSDGRTMRARVPNSSVIAESRPDGTMDLFVRRIDVDRVKMLGADCQ